jgi:hypothetical protein
MSVYFITAREVGMVKIGCAFNPRSRFNTIQTSSPVEVALEAWVSGSYPEEREFHSRFAHLRVRGEWFKLTPEIEEIIASNPILVTKSNPLFLKKAREMQGKRTNDIQLIYQREADAKRYAAAMTEMHAAREREAALSETSA